MAAELDASICASLCVDDVAGGGSNVSECVCVCYYGTRRLKRKMVSVK